MNTPVWFPQFVETCAPGSRQQVTEEEFSYIWVAFDQYLNEHCKEETINRIMPKTVIAVIGGLSDPTKYNGFHPALCLHFTEFLKLMQTHFLD